MLIWPSTSPTAAEVENVSAMQGVFAYEVRHMNLQPCVLPACWVAMFVLASPFAMSGEKRKPDFTEARGVLERAIRDRAFPGCTVEVGTEDRVLWSEALGRFDYTDGTRVTTSTIYDLASLTKVAGTTAVYMRLVALDKVRLNKPVSQFLPGFIEGAASDEEKSWRQKITIEHLLTHTAGLAAWKPLYKSVNSYAALLQAIYATPLESEPGRRFRYSDLGMILAGEIASRIGGKPLAELERELVFNPLGMSDTLRHPSTNLLARIPPTEKLPDTGEFVHGVVHDENARAGEGITGHAGLFSTVGDLGKLVTEFLRALDGRSAWCPKEVVQDFFTERKLDDGSHRTLGWGLVRNGDGSYGPALSHTGFTGTSIWIDPERKLYVVLLTNRVHPTRDNNKISSARGEFIGSVVATVEGASTPKPD